MDAVSALNTSERLAAQGAEPPLSSRAVRPEEFSETGTGDVQAEATVSEDDVDDGTSSTSTATTDLFEAWASPEEPAIAQPRKLGLQIHPEGWSGSSYDDYDIITIHGIRDDYRTAWIDDDGDWWVRNQLFKDMSARQIDYSYEIDEDSDIFDPDGIHLHAKRLLDRYAEMRSQLDETETDRPIIWICHDFGGLIAKKALTLASFNSDTYEKIAILTTCIIFLGTPHRAVSLEDLEDRIHHLLCLPGPKIRRGAIRKVRALALQTESINIGFLETKLLDRAVIFNVFTQNKDDSLRDSQGDSDSPLVSETNSQDDTSVSRGPVTPFQRYSHCLGHSFEASGRYRIEAADHLDLVKGKLDAKWLSNLFNAWGAPIRANYRILPLQARVFALLPPTRVLQWHADPMQPRHPVVAWITQTSAFNDFESNDGPIILHLHAGGNSKLNISEASQRLYLLYDMETTCPEPTGDESSPRLPYKSTLFFEFDRQDPRYCSLKSMLIFFINAIIWHFGSDYETKLVQELGFLNDSRSWSLADLYHLYSVLRPNAGINDLTFFISCFHHCEASERKWFLDRVLADQRSIDINYRVILSTCGKDDLLVDFSPNDSLLQIDLEDCSVLRDQITEKAREDHAGLTHSLGVLVHQRPIYQNLIEALEGVLRECVDNGTPHLGQSILSWLSHFGHGLPGANITRAIGMLSPVTPHALLETFISHLPDHKQAWAETVIHLVKYAAEPWSPEALAEALAVEGSPDEDPVLDIDHDGVMRDIEEAFGGMIAARGRDVRFIDDSLYEVDVLDSQEAKDEFDREAKIHGQLATICLRYLCFRRSPGDLCDALHSDVQWSASDTPLLALLSYPRRSMLEYAVRFWPHHYHLSGSHKPQDLVFELFDRQETRHAWELAHYTLSNTFVRIERAYMSPLPTLAMLGLDELVDAYIAREKSLPSFNSNDLEKICWFAITEATRNGHRQIAQHLLGMVGFDPGELSTAIFWAAAWGQTTSVLDDLLDKIPSSKLRDFEWPEHVMCRAAASGMAHNLLHSLLESGRDVNAHYGYYDSPIITIAAWWDQKVTVEFLLGLDVDLDLEARDMDGSTALHTAISRPYPDIVELLLSRRAQLCLEAEDDSNALRLAIEQGAFTATELVFRRSHSDNLREEWQEGDTGSLPNQLLRKAIETGYKRCVKVLLANGASTTAVAHSGPDSVLLKAAANGHTNVVRLLLEKFEELGQVYEDKEPLLIEAVKKKDLALISLLIEQGAKTNWEDSTSSTPLTWAANRGNLDIIRRLLAAGADVNFKGTGDSPLSTAIYHDNMEAAKLFLDEGADVLWTATDGYTALHEAWELAEIVPDLIRHGAKVDARSAWGHVIAVFARGENAPALTALIKHAGDALDVNVVFDEQGPVESSIQEDVGCTPLHIACTKGSVACVEILLKAGADPDLQDPRGLTALAACLLCANRVSAEKCIKLLIARRTNLFVVDKKGDTLLHKVQPATPVTTVKLLAQAGAPTDWENREQETPLCAAIKADNFDVAEYLVVHAKVRVNLYLRQHGSLLHLACSRGHQTFVKMLIDAKADHTVVHPSFGESLLYTALGIGDSGARARMVRYLVDDVKVDVNAIGGRFKYPIIKAAGGFFPFRSAARVILGFLVRRGADLEASDDQGRRAVHLAASSTSAHGLHILLTGKTPVNTNVMDKFGRMPIHFAASGPIPGCLDYLLREKQVTEVDTPDSDGWTPLLWAARSIAYSHIFQELLGKNADLWTRGSGYADPADTETSWTALKIAAFSSADPIIRDMLTPKAGARQRIRDGKVEVWDDSEHESQLGHDKNRRCWSCFARIRGIAWVCVECSHVFLCTKCYRHRLEMHDADHIFREVGPLYEPSPRYSSNPSTGSERSESRGSGVERARAASPPRTQEGSDPATGNNHLSSADQGAEVRAASEDAESAARVSLDKGDGDDTSGNASIRVDN